MDKVRWGIIGCGDVTEVKSGPGFYKCRRSELVAVMRRDAAKAADYAKRHSVRKWYDDADRLINDPDVNAVYIATPPGSHEFYAMKVLAARKPCYVEKPMTRNTAEARRMVDGFKAAGVPLFVAYYRRALPRFLKVKEILESGLLGRLHTIAYRYQDGQMLQHKESVPWRLEPEFSGGGLLLDLGSHALDLLDWLMGPLRVRKGEAYNWGRKHAVEDAAMISFETEQGIGGIARWQFAGDRNEDVFELGGDGGNVTFSCFASAPVRLRRPGMPEEIFEIPHPEHVGMPLIQLVVDDLLEIGKCPSTGDSGLRTQALMDTALEKYYGGREDGFWKRKWPLA